MLGWSSLEFARLSSRIVNEGRSRLCLVIVNEAFFRLSTRSLCHFLSRRQRGTSNFRRAQASSRIVNEGAITPGEYNQLLLVSSTRHGRLPASTVSLGEYKLALSCRQRGANGKYKVHFLSLCLLHQPIGTSRVDSHCR